MNKLYKVFLLVLVSFCVYGCKPSITLFNTDESVNVDKFYTKSGVTNYTINKLDYITIDVFANDGEIILDPDNFYKQGGTTNSSGISQGLQNQGGGKNSLPMYYQVYADGYAFLPKIGRVYLEGLTLYQADTLLAGKLEKYYSKPYVRTAFYNKRVTISGALGERIVPLENEYLSVLEVVASMSSGSTNGGGTRTNTRSSGQGQQGSLLKTDPRKIRIIRGYLSEDPAVELIDISTIQGLAKAKMIYVQPNDIIYLEPRRKFDNEGLRNISTVVGTTSGVISLVTTILLLTSQK